MAKSEDMLTAAKWADKIGVSQNKIKKAIKELEIEPDSKKGRCSYYSAETIDKVRKSL